MPSPSPIHTPEQAAAFQQQHQNMTQWLTQVQRDVMARAMQHNQRTRAQMGMRGAGDAASVQNGVDNSSQASPAPTHTVFREHIAPNSHTYQVETVMRVPNTPGGGMSPADIQNIIRNADGHQAAHAMASAMQRSTSNASLHNRHTAQQPPNANGSLGGSGRGTPDLGHTRLMPMAGPQGTSQSRHGPEVYILSSPDGPRALLFNNAGSETYYTPRLRTQASLPQLRYPSALGNVTYDSQTNRGRHNHHQPNVHLPHQTQQAPQARSQSQLRVQSQPQAQVQPQTENQLRERQVPVVQQQQVPGDGAQGQVQAQQQPPPQPIGFGAPGGIGMMHPGNPAAAAAIPPLLAQLLPHLWLLFRLAVFVWFFTSPTADWTRWLTIIAIAIGIFIFSTGVFNGVPEHIWRLLGGHLENLIPLEQPHGRRPAIAAPPNNNGDGRPEVNPADMAARLVAQRQGPQGWLLSQYRRIERAGLLFMASIAPGVAERHIANLEATARAERERREAEAAAAAAAAEAEAQSNGNLENQGEGTQADNNVEGGATHAHGQDTQTEAQNQPPQGGAVGFQEDNQGEDPARDQLIAV